MILMKTDYIIENLMIDGKTINTINIQNKEILIKTINEIMSNKVDIYFNDELIEKSKIDILDSLHSIDINKKDLLFNLYYKIEETLFYNIEYKNILDQNIDKIFKELLFKNVSNFDFSLDYKIINLLKLLDVKHQKNDNLYDVFISYINLLSKYNYKILFVLFLNNYFNANQIKDIKKELSYNEITIVNIETNINIDDLKKYREQTIFYFDDINCRII